jgi:hypothetical protein
VNKDCWEAYDAATKQDAEKVAYHGRKDSVMGETDDPTWASVNSRTRTRFT